MGDLSRRPSRRSLLPRNDTENSLTSFPDPSPDNLSPEAAMGTGHLNGLLDRPGPSMFDDDQASFSIDPQALSAAQPAVIKEVIRHHGAAKLVKRLSTLLAERDAHISALKRLAEDYNAPPHEINQTASRAKQAEQTRLALSKAAQTSAPTSTRPSNINEHDMNVTATDSAGNSVRGVVTMFGGSGKRRDGAKLTPTSSRDPSVPPLRSARPQSTDALSVKSSDGIMWASALFGGNGGKRRESRASREPVELKTQHDKAQLPPTLSDQYEDPHEDPHEGAWNKFLLKLAEVRAEAGDQNTSSELIGASHFGQEGPAGQKKMKTLIQLVLGGIPMSLRQFMWMELSNTHRLIEPGAYHHFLSLRASTDQSDIEAIIKDVPRTLTSQYEYYPGKGYQKLKEVLVAFVGKYDDLGYTQGLNTIAGYLLLALPSAEDAFWLLCNMVENYFSENYFSRTASMSGPLADNRVLRQYVRELVPQLGKHLDDLNVSDEHTVPLSWFFTAFSSVLPQDVLMRLWDVWLCVPGNKHFMFNVALALLKQNVGALLECKSEGEYWAVVGKLKVSEDSEKIGDFIKQAFQLRKTLEQVELRRALELNGIRKKNGSTEALYTPEREGRS